MDSMSGDDPNEVLDSDNESEESSSQSTIQSSSTTSATTTTSARPTPAPSKQPATKHLSSKAVPNLPKPTNIKSEPDVPDPPTSGSFF